MLFFHPALKVFVIHEAPLELLGYLDRYADVTVTHTTRTPTVSGFPWDVIHGSAASGFSCQEEFEAQQNPFRLIQLLTAVVVCTGSHMVVVVQATPITERLVRVGYCQRIQKALRDVKPFGGIT